MAGMAPALSPHHRDSRVQVPFTWQEQLTPELKRKCRTLVCNEGVCHGWTMGTPCSDTASIQVVQRTERT